MYGLIGFKFVLGVALLLCTLSLTMGDQCLGLHNGCNSYGFFESYKTLFTPACNEHDACYFCGHFYNITRHECDEIFHYDMKRLCDEEGGWGCYANAYVYWSGTRLFGSTYYTDSFLFPICKKACVKEMLVPNHPHPQIIQMDKK